MASFDTLQKLAEHPEWIAPRSDVRVFIGEPGAPEATRTTIEPGNVFSPGMKTFGVTWWLCLPDSNEFFATETAGLDALKWRYEAGYLPLIHCETTFGGVVVQHSLFQDGSARERSEAVCARLQLENRNQTANTIQVFVALRSLGPAGGPLHDLKIGQDGRSFWLAKRDLPLLGFDAAPTTIGCGIGDPSPLAREGIVPGETNAADQSGWCFGLARFDVTLAERQSWTVQFDCPQQTYGNLHRELPGSIIPHPEAFEERVKAHQTNWEARLSGVSLDVPDFAFREAFFAGLQHMLTAVVGDQARIAPLSYPLPWLRDSVYIIRCFDLAGLHDVAQAATSYCVRNDFFGGFGAEGDAPGQALWALVEHYRITRDKDWLRDIYPAIQRKCEWLFRMRRTAEPIQITVDTPVLALTHAERAAGIICLAAQHGLIMGAMDHGVEYSLGWVNHWALAGLHEAVYAARELGLTADADRYQTEADELLTALEAYTTDHPDYFEHERTVNSLLWPTRAWEHDPDRVKKPFTDWWANNRLKDDRFVPEPYWLYFEAAQAHNALLMGNPAPAWMVIRYRLDNQDLPGLYGWREGGQGVGTENAIYGVTLINQLRGCHKFESITPHGWSQAELFLLQRAMLIEEWQGGLLLFGGVPAEWLKPNARLSFARFPTWYGDVSAQLSVDNEGRAAHLTVSGVRVGTPLKVRLPMGEVAGVMGDEDTSFQLTW